MSEVDPFRPYEVVRASPTGVNVGVPSCLWQVNGQESPKISSKHQLVGPWRWSPWGAQPFVNVRQLSSQAHMTDTRRKLDDIAETFCVYPPSPEEWTGRREVVTGLSLKLYNLSCTKDLPERFDALERELERCYCSGAYLACIVLAQSIVETLMHKKSGGDREALGRFLEYCEDGVEDLRELRNNLLHAGRPSNRITLLAYTSERDALESDARGAISAVYHVARAFVRCGPNSSLKQTDPSLRD